MPLIHMLYVKYSSSVANEEAWHGQLAEVPLSRHNPATGELSVTQGQAVPAVPKDAMFKHPCDSSANGLISCASNTRR